MKRVLLLVLFAVLSGCGSSDGSSDLRGFVVVDGQLRWQRVYDTCSSTGGVISHFTSGRWPEHHGVVWLKTTEDYLYGRMYSQFIKPRTRLVAPTPRYLSYPMECAVVVELRPGRYRVTLSGIRFDTSARNHDGPDGAPHDYGDPWKTVEELGFRNGAPDRHLTGTAIPVMDGVLAPCFAICNYDEDISAMHEW